MSREATEDVLEEREEHQRTHRAMLNILMDHADERDRLGETHRAVLNMLDDLVADRAQLEQTQRATLNILEDFAVASEDLQRMNHELTKLDELKSEFVAMASHELRTPLTSITGFSSTMLNNWPTLSEAAKFEFVGIIDQQSQRLARLVEGLLTISRIESGALETFTSRIGVGGAIRQTIHDLGMEGVAFECAETVAVAADRDHFQQIMVNFLANAERHGAAPICIEVSTAGEAVHIAVIDHGAGVPEAFVPHLFERFAQADLDASRSAIGGEGKGAGLGLSIVDALARAQGGEVSYEPNEPTGSRFILRLPACGPE